MSTTSCPIASARCLKREKGRPQPKLQLLVFLEQIDDQPQKSVKIPLRLMLIESAHIFELRSALGLFRIPQHLQEQIVFSFKVCVKGLFFHTDFFGDLGKGGSFIAVYREKFQGGILNFIGFQSCAPPTNERSSVILTDDRWISKSLNFLIVIVTNNLPEQKMYVLMLNVIITNKGR